MEIPIMQNNQAKPQLKEIPYEKEETFKMVVSTLPEAVRQTFLIDLPHCHDVLNERLSEIRNSVNQADVNIDAPIPKRLEELEIHQAAALLMSDQLFIMREQLKQIAKEYQSSITQLQNSLQDIRRTSIAVLKKA